MKAKKPESIEFLDKSWTEEQRHKFVTELVENTNYIASKVGANEEGMAHALMLPRLLVLIATSISLGIKDLCTRMVIEAFICLDKDVARVPKGHVESAIDALYAILPTETKPKKNQKDILYKYANSIRKNNPAAYITDLPVYKGMFFLHKEYMRVIELANKKKITQKKASDLIGPIIVYLTGLAHGLTSTSWRQTIFSVLAAAGDQCVKELIKLKDLEKIYSSLVQMINIGTMLSGAAASAGVSIHGKVPGMPGAAPAREMGMNRQKRETLDFQADPTMFS